VLRQVLLQASRSSKLRSFVETAPGSRQVVRRYVPGTAPEDAVRACRELLGQGLTTTLDHLGEDTTDLDHARSVRDAYLTVLRQLSDAGLTQGGRVEVSVKLSAVGQALGDDGEKIALENARAICRR
jgi:proline dehydrogenase